MAVANSTVTLAAATTTALYTGTNGAANIPQGVLLQNSTGADLFVGGPGVTNSGATLGVTVANGKTLTVDLISGEIVYGYSVAGGDVITLTTRN